MAGQDAASASVLTWTGLAGDGQILNAGNWSPAQPPAASDILVFPGTNDVLAQLTSGVTVGSFSFSAAPSALALDGAGLCAIGAQEHSSCASPTVMTNGTGAVLVARHLEPPFSFPVGRVARTDSLRELRLAPRQWKPLAPRTAVTIATEPNRAKTRRRFSFLELVEADPPPEEQSDSAPTAQLPPDRKTAVLDSWGRSPDANAKQPQPACDVTGLRPLPAGEPGEPPRRVLEASAVETPGFPSPNHEPAARDHVPFTRAVSAQRNTISAPSATIVWDGGGADARWSTVLNWSTDAVPLSTDSVQFASGFASGTTIDLNGNRTVNSLVISTTTAFSIINNTLTLSSGSLTRNDVAGVEADQTISSNIVLGASGTWSIGGSGSFIVAGTVSGASGLTKTDVGTLVLTGANTFSGGTVINAGTVAINNVNSLGASGAAATINAATLQVSASFNSTRNFTLGHAASTILIDSAQTFTMAGTVSGSGGLTKIGGGTLIISGGATYTGNVAINGGTFVAGGSTATFALGDPTIAGRTVTVNNAGTLLSFTTNNVFGQGFGNLPAMTLNAGTTLTATRYNVLGALTLNGATLTQASTDANGYEGYQFRGNVTVGGSAASTIVTTNGKGNHLSTNTVFNVADATGDAAADLIVSAPLLDQSNDFGAAAGALTKTGLGTMVLSGANTYSGSTTVSAGVLNIQNAAALGTTAAGTSVSSGAALQIQGGIAVGNEALSLNGSGITGTGALRNISGNNSMAGPIALASASTIGSDAGTLTLGGVISGGFALTKAGAGTVTLTGANTLSGAVTVSSGTLTLATPSGSALGSVSSITVGAGGTLLLGASNQINNTAGITLAGGTFGKGNFSEGLANSAGVGTLTLAASNSILDFGTGTVGVLTFANFAPGTYSIQIVNWTGTANTVGNGTTDRLIFNSSQTLNLASFNFAGYLPGAVQFSLGGGWYEVTPFAPVPEASTFACVILGFCGLVLYQRYRPRKIKDGLPRA